ncbi:hypothetical protein BDQ17DRAFT_1348649, partial [Cyathus striatus]
MPHTTDRFPSSFPSFFFSSDVIIQFHEYLISILIPFLFISGILVDWATHGICGRGVLLDLVRYHTLNGKVLPYDPWTSHGISVGELEACAAHQGVSFRAGDILLLRVGFIQKYYRVLKRNAMRFLGKRRLCMFFPMCWNWTHFASAGI